MSFKQALAATLKHEGGYSDHPHDRGGPTNYGITEAVAREHGYNGPMRDIPMQVVETIYEVSYWNRVQGDHLAALSQALAAKVFDIAVNMGPGRAGQFLQTAINLFADAPIKVDGAIGNGTLSALRRLSKNDIPLIVQALRHLQADWYITLALKTPSQKTFIRGWLKRAQS